MRRSAKRLSLPVTLLAAGLLAGCGSTISSSIGSLPSRTATVSARPSVTVTVTSAPTAPATGTAAPAAASGTSLIWLWVLLGILVLAGLIALIARSGRRRSAAAAAGWRSRLVDAYAKGSALHDAMSVAAAPGGLAGTDGAARWADIQRRADDLAQMLYALREEVPQHSPDGARIADTLASLQAVRSAMDAERVPGGASAGQADAVRSRLASFEYSLRALGALAQSLPWPRRQQ